jgi:hypothetical protein
MRARKEFEWLFDNQAIYRKKLQLLIAWING